MGMLKEFKEFAMKGNLIDIAVAFVMGGAFGKVVTNFTEGIVAPLIGILTGGQDFSDKVIVLKHATASVLDPAGKEVVAATKEVAIKWGSFVTAIIDFIIVAFVMFLIIKAINSLKKKEVPPPAALTPTEKLLVEIRDELKKRP
ncbi:MAG: large-conductance mechanosensitive channel protein MscL [Bacteroidota bacterium]|nr:large-conductance mechanosensitive channel protein MscL [Bacteroidota bacterium]MDP4217860.1 large-conductance mechanosensitive channel protein MscL [Bacteroidota bacterium]MDP4247295.1 large-conductance mechanosensitive channel protein MscL [Bacteroidota bacterium]MDP4254544.1 large-conductance mechanosensitive channel protein MscL [Bacteroidota bacterium]MDP4258989.1 large-conductance mechanosensitive channel protein MscL [Bacteroidota bacterium]